MRKTLKLIREISIIVLMIAACATRLHAQTYPVQVNAQVTPPFSPYLNDYTEAGAQRFMVNFLLRDPTLPEYRCKLRLTIEGVGITIRTKPGFVPQPLVLPGGGIPLQLYGEDLQEYFNPNSLDFAGITRSQYAKGAKLPDGVYRFTIEVLDYNRGTVVSNKGTTVAWIILNDPPLLNMPRTDTKVRILDPTNIPFTWTPRHTGSPNSAFTTEYIFRLVEIWPITRNPYDAFLSQQPLYEITTNATQIVYGPAEPALIPGRKYAWQVQAKDAEARDLFKNQGKSEVFVFQFGDALGAPEGLYLQTANPTSLVVRWEQNVAGTDAVKYRVRYRPRKDRNHENWYEEETEDQWRALAQLQPNTEYEVQVRAEQTTQVSEYSPVKIFKTAAPGANEFACKTDVSPPPAPATNAPAFRLGVNDTIHAGGYDVLVRELTSNANGVYTGSGMAIVPWFMDAKVRVTFKSINVNTQHWLTSGEIKSVWNPDSKFLVTPDKRNDPKTTPTNGKDPVTVAETKTLIEITGTSIVTVTKNEDGDIEIHTSDGETQTLEKGKSYSIADETGNGYIVNEKGDITKTTAQEARDAAGRGDRNYTITLRFEKGKAEFGFDEKKYDALASNYQQLEDGPFIPWKAVSSKPDVVNAVLEGTDIDPKKVRFEVNGSPVVHGAFNGGISAVTVQGKAEGTVEELLAVYAPSDTGKVNVLGKLNMVSYDQISRNLVIVPVNNAALPTGLSDVTLTRELTKIYGQAVADWKVSIAPAPLKVTLDEYFDDGESGLLSNYTADMKKVINAFGNLQEKTYYLFLVEKPRSGKNALGYMPRSKQAGFIFSDNLTSTNAIPTLAHELGHGAFNLKHIFSEYSLSKGATDNLMDYNNGTALCKYQWDHVHDPQRVIGLFEDDAEGESYHVDVDDKFLNKDGKTFSFLTYSGKIITIKKEGLTDVLLNYGTADFAQTADQVPGVLQSFTLDGKIYGIDFADGVYKSESGNYTDATVKKEDIDGVIFGLPCNASFSIYKFHKGSLEYYDGTEKANDLKDVINFPLRPFKTHDAIKKDGVLLQQTVETAKIGGCYWCMDESTAVMVKDYCQKPEILYITKLAQFRVAYPSDWAKFTSQGSDWANPAFVDDIQHPIANAGETVSYPQIPKGLWGEYLNINPALKSDFEANKDREEFFKEMYVQLYEFTTSRIEESADFWANITTNTLAYSVIQEVNKLGLPELEALDIEKKKIALEVLMKGPVLEPRENAFILLIATVKDDALRQELVEYIATTFTFSKVISQFHDFLGKDNYTKVITTLSSYINTEGKVVSSDKLQKAYDEKMVVVDIGVFNNQSSYTIDKNTIKFTGKKWVSVSTPMGATGTIEYFDLYTVPYDELIPIRFDTDCTIGDIQFKKGDLKKIPAIYACLLLDKGNQESLKKTGWLILDGVLFVVGVGEVKVFLTAGNWLRKIMVAGDLLGSGTNLLLDAGLEDKLPPAVAHRWRVFNLAMSLPQGISSLKSLVGDLAARSRAAKHGLNAAEQAALEKNIAKLEELTDEGRRLAKLLEARPALAEKLAELETRIPGIRQRFLDDYANSSDDMLAFMNKESSLLDDWSSLSPEAGRTFARGFDLIEEHRLANNLPGFDGNTIAFTLMEDGKTFFGYNSSITDALKESEKALRQRWFSKVDWSPKTYSSLSDAQVLLHGEAHSLMKAYEAAGGLPKKVILFVDRITCNICNGQLPYLLKSMGIQELKILQWKDKNGVALKLTIKAIE